MNKLLIGKTESTKDCQADDKNDKNINNNFVGNNNDEVDHKLDYKEYILTSCNTPACQTSNYQQTAASSITDAQKRSLVKAPKTVISRRATSGIVLITTKLNQSDESKFIHYNSGSGCSALNEKNLDIFNSVHKPTENFLPSTVQQDPTVDNSDQQQPKTATILVSKSKTKTGLPLLLKKSK